MEKERHFEDIMNEAEKLSGSFNANENWIVDTMNSVSMLESYDQLSAHKLVGDILWEVCTFCKKMEDRGITVNSAAALQSKINEMKERLLDPE
jgi:hypothetical protein